MGLPFAATLRGEPQRGHLDPQTLLVIEPSNNYPRHSEGDIVELQDGRLCLVYSRFRGAATDFSPADLVVRTSGDAGRTWDEGRVLVSGDEAGLKNVMSVSIVRLPTGELLLFYARVDSRSSVHQYVRRSSDEFRTLSPPVRLTSLEGYHVVNNDRVVRLPSGRLIVPANLHTEFDQEGNVAGEYSGLGVPFVYYSDDMYAEMYGIIRDEFYKAVAESGVKTTERPMLGAYVSDSTIHGLESGRSLARVFDYVANMVYEDAPGVRKTVARLAPATGKKLVIAISPGYQMSPPGDARSGVLEAVMGGSQGVIAWGYYMGMDAGHLADIADAVRMFGPVEDIILDGAIEDGYTCDWDTVNLLARKQGDATVLLVSDYSPIPGQVTVSVPGDQLLVVKDLYAAQEVGKLTRQQRRFQVELTRDFTVRLYYLGPPSVR